MIELSTEPVPSFFTALGERGKPAEHVADSAVDEVLAYLARGPAPVDPHSADQLVLPLALAQGRSEFHTTAVTRHLTTNVAVVRRFIDRPIACEGEEGQPGIVRIT
jgi:RNA 3'-terminal phosphate cyclase (ATP)